MSSSSPPNLRKLNSSVLARSLKSRWTKGGAMYPALGAQRNPKNCVFYLAAITPTLLVCSGIVWRWALPMTLMRVCLLVMMERWLNYITCPPVKLVILWYPYITSQHRVTYSIYYELWTCNRYIQHIGWSSYAYHFLSHRLNWRVVSPVMFVKGMTSLFCHDGNDYLESLSYCGPPLKQWWSRATYKNMGAMNSTRLNNLV